MNVPGCNHSLDALARGRIRLGRDDRRMELPRSNSSLLCP